jgi:hypothetical protein
MKYYFVYAEYYEHNQLKARFSNVFCVQNENPTSVYLSAVDQFMEKLNKLETPKVFSVNGLIIKQFHQVG